MKTSRPLLASLVALLAACCLPAADMKPIARVMTVLDVETDDAVGYATWLKDYNEIAKAKTGNPQLLRVFQTVYDGSSTGRVRVSASASSVAELAKQMSAVENDPAILANREHLRAIRKTGARVLYQAVRFEGPSPKGAYNYVTLAVVNDEAGYLKALDDLRGLLDGAGLKDIQLAAYRIIAGRGDHTHRITLSAPSSERQAVLLDVMATNQKMSEWIAQSAKFRTVISNSTSREITK